MKKVISNFERILGRQSTESERENLRRVKEVMGLQDNDAIWTVMMGLQHYQTLYEAMPDRIEQMSKKTLHDFTISAKQISDAAIAKSKCDLSRFVIESAQELARVNTFKDRFTWTCISISVFCFLMMLFGFYMYRFGYQSGYKTCQTEIVAQSNQQIHR